MGDLKLVTKGAIELPQGRDWASEAVYTTKTVYRNGGSWNKAEVTIRYDWLEGALDVVAFERLIGELNDPMTAEELAVRCLDAVKEVCYGWVRVQVVAAIPGATGKLTLLVKRREG